MNQIMNSLSLLLGGSAASASAPGASGLAGLLGGGAVRNGAISVDGLFVGADGGLTFEAALAARLKGQFNGQAGFANGAQAGAADGLVLPSDPAALWALYNNGQLDGRFGDLGEGIALGNGFATVEGDNLIIETTVGRITLPKIDEALLQDIRAEVLASAQAGEIALPPAWAEALASGDLIHPLHGGAQADPAEVLDILAGLGLVVPAAPAQPANRTIAPDETAIKAVSPSSQGDAAMAGAATPAFGKGTSAPDLAPGHASAQSRTETNPSAIPGATPGATPNGADAALAATDEMAASLRQGADKGADKVVTANGSNAAQAAGGVAGNGQAAGSGGGSNSNNSGGNNADGNASTANGEGAGASTGKSERSLQPFLSRLEEAFVARGLTITQPFTQHSGLTGTEPDAALTGTMTGLGASSSPANAPTVMTGAAQPGHAPTNSAWTPVAGQVAVQITRFAREGNHEFSIRIDPPELGRVDVKLEIAHDGKVNTVVSVDNEKTLQLLQRDQAQLERALAEAGLDTKGGTLDFSMNKQDDNGQRLADTPKGPGGEMTGAADMTEEPVANVSLGVSDRPLDIRV